LGERVQVKLNIESNQFPEGRTLKKDGNGEVIAKSWTEKQERKTAGLAVLGTVRGQSRSKCGRFAQKKRASGRMRGGQTWKGGEVGVFVSPDTQWVPKGSQKPKTPVGNNKGASGGGSWLCPHSLPSEVRRALRKSDD